MASVFVYSKRFLSFRLLVKNANLPRVLISSKSFCSKDNGISNKDLQSQKDSCEKNAENGTGKTKKSSEQRIKVSEGSKEAAKEKIAQLINEIEVPSVSASTTTSKLDLAKPLKRISKKERLEQAKSNMSTPEKEMKMAVKEVASSFNDSEKVESELSQKLKSLKLSHKAANVTDESKFDTDVNEKLMSSVEEVAETISDSPIPPRRELTQKLIETSKEKQGIPVSQRPMYYNAVPRYQQRRGGQISVMAQLRLEADMAAAKKAAAMEKRPFPRYNKQEQTPYNRPRRNEEMSIIEKMRLEAKFAASAKKNSYDNQRSAVEKQQKGRPERFDKQQTEEMSVIEQMREEARLDRKETVMRQVSKIDLFGSSSLNIFKLESEPKTESRNEFWRKLQEKQVRLLSQFAPANGFEEMIQWTEQGKHWKFPIDNQIDMGAEEHTGFHEHVFLERHLEGFPTRGPIRHFMELVVVGLSKNPFITVQRKIDNIEWFRNYFKEKENVLKESGALEK